MTIDGTAGVVTPPSDAPRGGIDPCLQAIQALLDDIGADRALRRVPELECAPELRPLARSANRLVDSLEELAAFLPLLSRGELTAPLPSQGCSMAKPLKALHEGLREITRRAEAVAQGDYTQRVHCMGDLSQAFNSMAELLAEREGALRAEIAARQEAEQRLQRERDLLVAGPLVTFRWGAKPDDSARYVSPNLSQFGYRPDDFVSGRLEYVNIIHTLDVERVMGTHAANGAAGLESWTQEYRVVDGSGATRWIRDYTHTTRDTDGTITCFEGYLIDITAQKEAEAALRRREQQLRMLALADDLTGLYNRRGLFALGEHAMRGVRRRKTGMVVIAIDVNGLHAINDRFGYERGDDALRETAELLRRAFPDSDVVARAGGDEFVALVEEREEAAAELARRLLRRVAASNTKGGRPYKLALDLGMVYWPPGQKATLQELIERADSRRREAREARAGS
jgi:diguanylate cyclase (GGDEF)-like protein/PAS domain S-box-containing protein